MNDAFAIQKKNALKMLWRFILVALGVQNQYSFFW